MSTIAIVYPSCDRHTKLQADAVYRGAQAVRSVNARLYTEEEAAAQLDELDAADAIAFGCPTYESSTTTPARAIILRAADGWTALAWKHEGVEVLATSSLHSGDKFDTLVGLVADLMQRSMSFAVRVSVPSAARPGDCQDNSNSNPATAALDRSGSSIGPMDAPTKADLDAAEGYGRRVAEITRQHAGEGND